MTRARGFPGGGEQVAAAAMGDVAGPAPGLGDRSDRSIHRPATAQATSLGETQDLSPSGRYRAYKQLGLVLLCGAWILLGLFHHDPWKPVDATSFGFAFDLWKNGDIVVPHLAGEASVDHPPLFDAMAATGIAAFGRLIPPHDAARLAIAACLCLTLWLLALAARELYGRGFRWPPVLVFIGCVGLWDRAHQLSPYVALLAAYSLAIYALALSLRRYLLGGALLGLAAGFAFLVHGFLAPVVMALTAIVLTAFRAWRRPRHAATLALAFLIALPLILAWPLALHARDQALFEEWWRTTSWEAFFGLVEGSPPREPMYYLKNLPWLAWPALPLAVWTFIARMRGFNGGWSTPGIQLPLALSVILLGLISFAAEPRAIIMMPLLVPLSLLGAAEIDTLNREYSGALDWFGILTFGLSGVLMWMLWTETVHSGLSEPVARLFRDTQPGYIAPFESFPFAASLFLTALWIMLVRPARRSNRRALLNWAAGMTLVWGLYASIWLPYLDSRRSYRSVAEALVTQIPRDACVASRNLGEPQRALFEYFGAIVTLRQETQGDTDCRYFLLQVGRDDQDLPPDSAWTKIWEGHRRGDDTERYLLFRHDA